MGIQCFMVVDTGRVEKRLRRFVWRQQAPCPGLFGYHNASIDIGENDAIYSDGGKYLADLTHTVPKDDPRWPAKCDGCGYLFTDEDPRQVNQHMIYLREDTGERWIETKLPPGAIREVFWLGEADKGPNGKQYLLRLPNGQIDWSVYGPTSGGRVDGNMSQGWTITGTMPNITASPSIDATGVWHGFLRDGILE